MVVGHGRDSALLADADDAQAGDRRGQAQDREVQALLAHVLEKPAGRARLERHADPRCRGAEPAQQARDGGRQCVRQIADPQQAERTLVRGAGGPPGDLRLGEDPTRLVQHGGAGRGERDAALRTGEQLHTQLRLELADLLTDGRLRNVQPLGRAPEVQFLGDGDEVPQMPKFHCE